MGMCARVRVWLYVRVCLWVRVFGLVVNIQLYNTMAFCICLCIDRHIYCVFISVRLKLGGLPSDCSARATGASTRTRGARQGHRLHEGQGAAGVARQLHALGGTVRPLPAACAWPCRCWAAVRASRRRRRAAPRGVRRPVAACRAARASASASRRPGPTGARIVTGRSRSAAARAQGRVQHRARGAADGGRLAQPEATVSAARHVEPRRARRRLQRQNTKQYLCLCRYLYVKTSVCPQHTYKCASVWTYVCRYR